MPLQNVRDPLVTTLHATIERIDRPAMWVTKNLFTRKSLFRAGTSKIRINRRMWGREIAQYNHWTNNGLTIARPGRESVEIDPWYWKYDLPMNLEEAFEPALNEDLTPKSPLQRLMEIDADFAMDLRMRADRRMELTHNQILIHGKAIIEGPGFDGKEVWGFDRDSALSVTVSPGEDFTNETGGKFNFIKSLIAMMKRKHGTSPTLMLVGTAVAAALDNSAEIREYLGANLGINAIHRPGPRAAVLGGQGLPYKLGNLTVIEMTDVYEDPATGELVPYFPENYFALVDPVKLGGTYGFGSVMHAKTGFQQVSELFYPYYSNDGERRNMFAASAPISFVMDANATCAVEAIL